MDLLGAYWDNHDDHLMVSIVVQNLVEIDAGVSITRNFQYFARLAYSSGVLVMSLSVIVPEKLLGNKKCDKEEEEEERHIFWPFLASL